MSIIAPPKQEVLVDKRTPESRRIEDAIKAQEQYAARVIEHYGRLSARMDRGDDYYREMEQWGGGGYGQKHHLPYRDWGHYSSMCYVGHVLGYCNNAVSGMVGKLICYTLGREYSLEVVERERSCNDGEKLPSNLESRLACVADDIADSIDIEHLELSMRERYTYGEEFIAIEPNEEDLQRAARGEAYQPKVATYDSCDIAPVNDARRAAQKFVDEGQIVLDNTEDFDLLVKLIQNAAYGIIYGKKMQPMYYLVHDNGYLAQSNYTGMVDETEYLSIVRADSMIHCKLGGGRKHPRGVPPFAKVKDAARACDELPRTIVDMLHVQAANAVVKKLPEKLSRARADDIARRTQDDSQKKKELNEYRDEVGTLITQAEVSNPGVNIGAEDFVKAIRVNKREVAQVADLAEFQATGDADMGSRANFQQATEPQIRRTEKERTHRQNCLAMIVWKCFQAKFALSNDQIEAAKRRYAVVAKFPELVRINEAELVKTTSVLVRDKVASRREAARRHQLDPDQQQKEIAEEQGGALEPGGVVPPGVVPADPVEEGFTVEGAMVS